MASYSVATGERAAHDKTLVASTVDTVTLADDFAEIEVVNVSGSAAIYYTLDGVTPTVGGAKTFVLPATIGSVVHTDPKVQGNTVKLISSGTPVYSVVGA